MLEAHERVFVYVRMVAGGEEVLRSKVRELAGLGSALADMIAEGVRGAVQLQPGTPLQIEYVDAEREVPLIAMAFDPERGEQVIKGHFPEAQRERLLGAQVDVSRVEERAGRQLDAIEREALSDALAQPTPDLLGLIREHIDADGRFEIRMPLPGFGGLDDGIDIPDGF